MKSFKPFIPKWYWILIGCGGEFNTDFDCKKGGEIEDDFGLSEMKKDIDAMYTIFKTNPKVKSDGNHQ